MNSIPTVPMPINEPDVLEIIPFLTQLVAASRKIQPHSPVFLLNTYCRSPWKTIQVGVPLALFHCRFMVSDFPGLASSAFAMAHESPIPNIHYLQANRSTRSITIIG